MKEEILKGVIIGMVTMTCIIVLAWAFGTKYDEWYENRYCYYIGAGVIKTDDETAVFEDDFEHLWTVKAEPQYTEGKEVILFMDTKCNNDVTDDEIIDIITWN